MKPYPSIGMALLLGALMHAPAKAAPELNAFYDVFSVHGAACL
jgi:hypothetical protein